MSQQAPLGLKAWSLTTHVTVCPLGPEGMVTYHTCDSITPLGLKALSLTTHVTTSTLEPEGMVTYHTFDSVTPLVLKALSLTTHVTTSTLGPEGIVTSGVVWTLFSLGGTNFIQNLTTKHQHRCNTGVM